MRLNHRVRLPGLLVGLLALALVGCGGGGGSTPDADDAEDPFVVVQEIPTNRQEVAADLSDVGGRIEIEFSVPLDEDTILDPANPFNGLSANLNMLDSNLIRVPGTPEVKGKYFRFIPPSTGLSNQQYTVTVTQNVTSKGTQILDRTYYTSFTVGPDIYAPIIRRSFPVQNQNDVALDEEITFTFNESLDPGSVNTQTVVVQDGGTNPPVTINGTVVLTNNGFDIKFIPDPTTGLPSGTTVVVSLQGGNGGIADETSGIPFVGDPTNNNLFVLQFNTRVSNEPINQFAVNAVYFTAGDSVGTIDEIGTQTGTGNSGVVPNSRKKIGSPGEIVVDSRVNGNGDTFAYIVDRASSTIAVMNTFNSRVVGRIPVRDPRGIGISPAGNGLYISEYGSDLLAQFSTNNALPGTNIWVKGSDPATSSSVLLNRWTVGRGPTGVAHAPDQAQVFVTNATESSVSVVNIVTGSTITWQAGANPVDVSVSLTFPGLGFFACVTNLGLGIDDPGSASLWWSANPNVQQWFITGLQNPRGLIYDGGVNWHVANSGSDFVSTVQLQVAGNTIVPAIVLTFPTGKSPQNCSLAATANILYASCLGDGSVTRNNAANPSVPMVPPLWEVPGVRYIATLRNQ